MPLDSFMNFIDQGSRLRSEIISQAQSSAEASGNEKAVVADEAEKIGPEFQWFSEFIA